MNTASIQQEVVATTDASLSLHAGEFVWNTPSTTPAHEYLLPAVQKCLWRAQARTVLDLGCGNGALTAALHRDGFMMTGTDVSESGIRIASRHFPEIPFAHAEMSAPLPRHLRQRFDAVIAVEVIEHLLLPRLLFERAKEALRPGGSLIVTTPFHGYWKNLALALTNKFDTHWHPLRDFGHVKFFSIETLAQLFREQGFQIEHSTRVGRVPALAKSMVLQGTPASGPGGFQP